MTGLFAQIAEAAIGVTGVGQAAGGLVGQLAPMGIEMGAEGLMMKFSRSDESQADAVGAMIYMIFTAPEADFNALQPTYDAMVKSIQFR